MQGPPDTPYEHGTFELYCQFGPDYPVKPPTIRFVTVMYHCNINSSGRICHNIFDRGYNAHITMKEILEAVYGLLIAPEAEDPLDSILAEKFQSSKEEYEQEAKEHTARTAAKSFNDKEKQLSKLQQSCELLKKQGKEGLLHHQRKHKSGHLLCLRGLSQVEKNRFENLKDRVRRLRARPDPEGHGQGAVKKMEEFCLQYTYPQCPEQKYIRVESLSMLYITEGTMVHLTHWKIWASLKTKDQQ
ncbi:unnamed protein product [Arctogadus glacialis]